MSQSDTGSVIKKLVGPHFSLLDRYLSGPSTGLVIEKGGGISGTACQAHACYLAEAMIHVDGKDKIYIAILDGERLMYFSNDPVYKTKIHPSVSKFACGRGGNAKIAYMNK